MVDDFEYFVLGVCGIGWVVVICANACFGYGSLGVIVVCSRGGVVEGYVPVLV